ncbi:MAG: hypothetical protein LIP01_11715 [Tannerellaceae bacterium]|nr:hypothetical protein [Tannerellaceae bacterium]
MASFNYVLVPEEHFGKLELSGTRNKIKGYYLLNQKDFSGVEGSTLYEKVTPYGGIIVSEAEAEQIKAGRLSPPPLSVKDDFQATEVIAEEDNNEDTTQLNSRPNQTTQRRRGGEGIKNQVKTKRKVRRKQYEFSIRL